MTSQEIIEIIFKTFPPVVSILIVAVLYLFKNYKTEIASYLTSGNIGSKKSLYNHDLFSLINKILNVDINNIYFENDEVKSLIFRDFITIKLQSINDRTVEFIDNLELKKIEKDELSKIVKYLITEIVKDYNNKSHELFIKNGLTNEQANHIIKIFNLWHDDTLKAVYSSVDRVLTSGYYKTNYSKIISILEIFTMAVELTVSDGVKSFKELNGYFKTVKYKNK